MAVFPKISVLALLFAVLAVGCNAAHVPSSGVPGGTESLVSPGTPQTTLGTHPEPAKLESIVRNQLSERGIDPDRPVAAVPGAGNSVIDLEWIPYDPDGAGPLNPTGFQLSWTDRLVGDYDQNGEVNLSDITPLALAWSATVVYELPQLHDGIEGYPLGDPDYDGDVAEGEAPLPGSGASNWRLARIDGDSNSEINLADLTPLSIHFGERFDGYRIYRRGPGEDEYLPIEDSANPGEPLLISRLEADNPAGSDPTRPLRYLHIDEEVSPEEDWNYYVVQFDAVSASEGPVSGEDNRPVSARLQADVTQGGIPLTVNFDASESTTRSGTLTGFRWDLNGDGLIDEDTGMVPAAQKIFTASGAWLVSVEVTNSAGETDISSLIISVTQPPFAVLEVLPVQREVPITLTVDASTSFDPDGEITRYEWDMDYDGIFELDTGPVSQRSITHGIPGTFGIGVRVRDNLGATAETTAEYTLVDDYDEIEQNDIPAEAMDLGIFGSGDSHGPLSGGIGPDFYDGDEVDWYRFSVADGVSISAQILFTHTDADLTLELRRVSGLELWDTGSSQTDNEHIESRLPRSEPYYLKVFRADGSVGGSALYTLDFALSPLVYDELEDNDSAAGAQDLGDISVLPIVGHWGSLGPAGLDGDDEDWYRFTASLAADYTIDLQFLHSDADLELQVYEAADLNLVGVSNSVDDGETVDVSLDPADYLVRCSRFSGDHANYQLSVIFAN